MTPEQQQELEFLRSRVSELESKINETAELDLAFAFSLPPTLEKILRLLLAQQRVTTEQLAARLPGGTEVKGALFRLRDRLKPFGVKIQSRRHLGYWIDAADKKKIGIVVKNTAPGKKVA